MERAASRPELPAGGGLIGVAIRNPVFTTMLMVGLVVLGLFSFRRLSIAQYPDVSIPVISIQTTYPGSSPEVIEREVTQPIEEAVNPVQGVDTITSRSLEGVSAVIVELDLGTDLDAATAEVRSKIEQIRRQLPEGIDPPVVQQFDPAELPILSLALSSERLGIGALTTLAEERVREVLEGVDGVGRVEIAGGLEREVHVLLQPVEMQARGLSVQQVMSALRQQNLEVPAGRIEQGPTEQLVRVYGRLERPEQFGQVIVADEGGDFVRLDQIARIEDTTEEERSLALVDGERAVGIDILKVAGGNTVDVADGVRAAVDRLRDLLPEGVDVAVVRDNSVDIRNSVRSVQEELLLGATLTVLIVLVFLGDLRATVITALALPISVISTFILFDFMGFTLNILTLMALALSIGILIDDAIVVIENIVRHREMGKGALAAAFDGTQEIFLAVMATTLSFVAVFVPVAFMGGIIGRFFYEFGLTVAWAVLVSLFVSFTLTPMLGAWWRSRGGGRAPGRLRRASGRFRERFDAAFDRVGHGYGRLVHWALAHRLVTLGIAVASLVTAFALFPLVGGSFMPEQDAGQFTVLFETPSGSSFDYGAAKAAQVGELLRDLPGVELTYTTLGAGVTGTVTEGQVYVDLLPLDERDTTQQTIMQRGREALAGLYGVEVAVLEAGGIGGAARPIQVVLRGPEIATLERLSAEVADAVAAAPGAIEIESTLGDPKPEVRLEVDLERARDLGLDAGAIASAVRPLLAGETATTWEDPSGEERDVVVRLPVEERTTAGRIADLPLAVRRGEETVTVPLGQVARLSTGESPAEIEREDLARVARVEANVAPGASLAEVSAAIREGIAPIEVPEGYAVSLGGETEELEETTGYVLESLFLAIVLIYLILASQFGSFLQPVAIMVSLPLSLVGVLVALVLTGDTLNIMSMIGVILLMGLVTKNAILLVDNANQRRAEGEGIRDAVAEAGRVRLRPILMTTLATIAGMVPIALALGEGGGFRAPMARAVIGGIVTSTVLTLVVIPVVYTYFEGAAERLRARAGRSRRGVRSAEAEG